MGDEERERRPPRLTLTIAKTSTALGVLIEQKIGIPTTPTVLTEITAGLESPRGSAKDAASVLDKDPAIAAQVLGHLNSSFYGLKNPVAYINLGCSILGV